LNSLVCPGDDAGEKKEDKPESCGPDSGVVGKMFGFD
jgi:hypothetical protein